MSARKMVINPWGWACVFMVCPPGFFVFRDLLCLKTEYTTDGRSEAFCDTGEAFWGGATTEQEREALIVQPVIVEWEEF